MAAEEEGVEGFAVHEFFSKKLEINLLSFYELAFEIVAHIKIRPRVHEQELEADEDLDEDDDDEGEEGADEAALEGDDQHEAGDHEEGAHLNIDSNSKHHCSHWQLFELEQMDGEEGEEDHEAIIKLVCHANKLIFCLKKQQGHDVHFPFIILSVSRFINSYKKPHANHINNRMHITHVLLRDIVVCQVIEETVNVQGSCWVLDWASFAD